MDQQDFSGFPPSSLKISLKTEPVETADHWEEHIMGTFPTRTGMDYSASPVKGKKTLSN